ncbi:hypothetical protein GCM10020000_03770 [Streptomyces olivoverticillatus]
MTAEEDEILARALGALLREDPYDLRPGAVVERRPDGDWLVLPEVDIPVRPDGFQCEIRVRPVPGLGAVLDRLREGVAERDLPGFDAFRTECDQAVAMVRLQWRERSRVVERLAEEHGPVEEWTGVRGSLAFEALAAFRDHPVYPTGRVRNGLDERQLLAYAPEFRPAFGLRWLVLPRDALALGRRARLPRWWPTAASLGLARSGDGYLALPVHPLTTEGPLAEAVTAAGLGGSARLAESTWLSRGPHAVHADRRRCRRPRRPHQTPPGHVHLGTAQPAHHQTGCPAQRRVRAATGGGDRRSRAPLRRRRAAHR